MCGRMGVGGGCGGGGKGRGDLTTWMTLCNCWQFPSRNREVAVNLIQGNFSP